MPHGDGGRALKKAEKRIKERKEIQSRINKIIEAAHKKDKGETHWH